MRCRGPAIRRRPQGIKQDRGWPGFRLVANFEEANQRWQCLSDIDIPIETDDDSILRCKRKGPGRGNEAHRWRQLRTPLLFLSCLPRRADRPFFLGLLGLLMLAMKPTVGAGWGIVLSGTPAASAALAKLPVPMHSTHDSDSRHLVSDGVDRLQLACRPPSPFPCPVSCANDDCTFCGAGRHSYMARCGTMTSSGMARVQPSASADE